MNQRRNTQASDAFNYPLTDWMTAEKIGSKVDPTHGSIPLAHFVLIAFAVGQAFVCCCMGWAPATVHQLVAALLQARTLCAGWHQTLLRFLVGRLVSAGAL